MEQNFKEVMEKVKVAASQAVDVAGKAADVASKKAGEFANSAKLNLQIFDLNTEVEVLFKEIGKSVYLTHTGVEIDAADIDAKLNLVDAKYQQISTIRENLSERKSSLKCPNCGKECTKTDIYCSACGFELK